MNEEKIVLRGARRLKKAFPHLNDNEVINIAWEITKEIRTDNGEPYIEKIEETIKNICGEQ